MKKLIPLALIGLAGCLEPPVPGFNFNETVQSVDDSLPGGVSFTQDIPFVSVTRVNDEPLTASDRDLAIGAYRSFCATKGQVFLGNGRDLALGLPAFREGAWLIAGECITPPPPSGPGAPPPADILIAGPIDPNAVAQAPAQ